MAEKLVDLAAECGADAVKFQTFITDNVESRSAVKPSYFSNRETSIDKIEFSRSLELTLPEFAGLKRRAEKQGLIFLSTACDTLALDLLLEIGVAAIKIGSSDTNNFPLLRKAAQPNLPIILSTGISTLAEVEAAVAQLRLHGCSQLAVLQCTSNYPIEPADAQLAVMSTYRQQFDCPVGFSDHTEGCWASVAAVALGASIIEKHFTISKNLPGVDHPASLEPEEFKQLVDAVRKVEAALGSTQKQVLVCEQEHRFSMRKSIVAAKKLPVGTILSAQDLLVKRPGSGIPPSEIDRVIGKRLSAAANFDDIITWEMLK